MEATEKLIERLKERQGEMTQAEFAAHLGISAGFLSHLYGGTRQIGLDTMLRITERYPDLAYLFLAESVPSKSPQIEGDTL